MALHSSPPKLYEGNPEGNQIGVSFRRGKEYPPTYADLRVKYEETVLDLKKKVEEKLGIPVDKQQLFWHHKELRDDLYGHLTMQKLSMHTGSSLRGYDLTVTPDYWPKVEETEKGLCEIVGPPKDAPIEEPVDERIRMGYEDGLTMAEAIQKYRGHSWYSKGPPETEFEITITIEGAVGTNESVFVDFAGNRCRTGKIRVPDGADMSRGGNCIFILTQPDVGDINTFTCGLFNSTKGVLRFIEPADTKSPTPLSVSQVIVKNVVNERCWKFSPKTPKAVQAAGEYMATFDKTDLQ